MAKRSVDVSRELDRNEHCLRMLESWASGAEIAPDGREFVVARVRRMVAAERRRFPRRLTDRESALRELRAVLQLIDPSLRDDRKAAKRIKDMLSAYERVEWKRDQRTDGPPLGDPIRGLMFRILKCRDGEILSTERTRKIIATPRRKRQQKRGAALGQISTLN